VATYKGKPLRPYSFDIVSIARKTHSYSRDRVWAEPNALNYNVLIVMQKNMKKSINEIKLAIL
jgi:hypothetical protein